MNAMSTHNFEFAVNAPEDCLCNIWHYVPTCGESESIPDYEDADMPGSVLCYFQDCTIEDLQGINEEWSASFAESYMGFDSENGILSFSLPEFRHLAGIPRPMAVF